MDVSLSFQSAGRPHCVFIKQHPWPGGADGTWHWPGISPLMKSKTMPVQLDVFLHSDMQSSKVYAFVLPTLKMSNPPQLRLRKMHGADEVHVIDNGVSNETVTVLSFHSPGMSPVGLDARREQHNHDATIYHDETNATRKPSSA